MTVLASGSKGNAAVVSAGGTHLLVDAGLSCRELVRRMEAAGECPESLTAILITHEHLDHVAGLTVLARRYGLPVFFTEATHRAWTRMVRPRSTMTYTKWLEHLQREREARAVASAPGHLPAHMHTALAPRQGAGELLSLKAGGTAVLSEVPSNAPSEAPCNLPSQALSQTVDDEYRVRRPAEPAAAGGSPSPKLDPAFLPAVEYFSAGRKFSIGEIEIQPFTIPHDAADPCGFVFHARSENLRMAIATDLGYIPPNVKVALRSVDVLLLEANHDLEMLKDGPYPWSLKQRVLSRVGHLSNDAAAEFLLRDYDGGAHTIVLGHLSEQNNLPELARFSAERAIGDRMRLLGNRVMLAEQHAPLESISL